jgi:outer membrane protein TolC
MSTRLVVPLSLMFSCLVGGTNLVAQDRQPTRALSLDEALAIAEKESETVAIARAGIEVARGEQRQARSEFFPQLSASARYLRTLKTQFAGLADEGDGGPPPPSSCPTFVANPLRVPG